MRTHLPVALLLAWTAACAAQDPPPAPAPVVTVQSPVAASDLRERAAGAENRGRFAEAADCWLQLVQQQPLRAEWVIAAGRCLGRSGRFNDAIDLLSQKRSDFAGVGDLTAMLARTHLLKAEQDQGALHPELSYADAARLAEEVLAADANHEDARLILAQARYGLGDWQAADAAAEEAARRFPQRSGAQILIGRIAFDQFKLLQQQLAGQQPDERTHAELVAALDLQRKRAQAAFTRAAELDPQRTFARIALAELAIRDRDPDAALRHWTLALAADPLARVEHEWLFAHVGWQQRRDFYAAAAAQYRQRPDAQPAAAAVLDWYRARALYDGSQWQAARELFAAVLATKADYTNACYWGALCAWQQNDHDGAEELAARYAAASATAFADVLRNLPPERRGELGTLVQYLGDRAYKAGRIDRSRDLNHVIACLRDSADAWNNFAFLCRETGRFDDATAAYEHALEKEPGSPQLWNDAAVILQYHQPSPANWQKARTMYEKAQALADQVLADAAADQVARERAAKARSDARLNLDKLPK